MFKEIKEAREQFKMLKDLQSKIGNIDMNNPEEMLKSMGFNLNDINKHFEEIDDEMSSDYMKVNLNYVNDSENKNPSYVYDYDSGFDLRSNEEVLLNPFDRALVPTGLKFDIPPGYEIQVRSKSGLALKEGLMVLNSPGTVDNGYTGEIKVIIFNTTNQTKKIEKGQKIAQAVLSPVAIAKLVNLIQVKEIKEKDRNENGFGSTGL
jgi:dUTP pyrophosphatase